MDNPKRGSGSKHSRENVPIAEGDEPIMEASEIEELSTLELCDWIARNFRERGGNPRAIHLLRNRIEEMGIVQDQARRAIEEMSEAVDKLRSPALRLGTLLQVLGARRALICVNGAEFVANVDPSLPESGLEVGMRVLVNEAYAVTDTFGLDRNGPIVKVTEVLSEGRLRVGNESGHTDTIVLRSASVGKEKVKPGVDVRLDANQRVAVEIVGSGKRIDRSLAQVDTVPWSAIGGQEEAVRAIRDSIELPLLHAALFKRFRHAVPKGFLLYGPPGCGKTLLGKATAHNLRVQLREATGVDRPEFFLHVKGPEILNMWLGESERQVRELFVQCREKAAEGQLAFLFIDEAESVLGTRHAPRGGSNILSTLVPMFCTEMDGLEPLQNVVVILASNRADLIDPAILRPGRIDRKIRVRRPDLAAARAIYGIYLSEDLPLAGSREVLIDEISSAHFDATEANRFLEVVYRSGRREFLHRGDLASGAIIAAIIERAKGHAIQRSISEGHESPLGIEDLKRALDKEYQENDLFPPSDITEDWLKLTDLDASNVVRLGPYRTLEKRFGTEPSMV